MSVKGLIGAAIGGTIGFFISGGNPWGALYGASLGFGLGMALDTPDVPSLGSPNEPFTVTGNVIGLPIYDLLGTAKIVGGTLLCYGGERAEPQYTEAQGGKGGGAQQQQTGNYYYMSWVVGLCKGPVDTLHAIYRDNEEVPIWTGPLDRPALGGEETIAIPNFGSITFYFGTSDHALNSSIGTLLDDNSLNSPMRGLCYAFFNDCLLGIYDRLPTLSFMMTKRPAQGFSANHEIGTYDYNGAHAQYAILNTMAGTPTAWLHNADFATAASTLFTEGRGVSILFNRAEAALSYLENVNRHIDMILRYGNDGKFHPMLIRDDYNVATIPTVDNDNFLEDPTFKRRSWIDTINEMKVQYEEIFNVDESDIVEDDFNYTGAENRVTLSTWASLNGVPWSYSAGQFFVEKSGGKLVNDNSIAVQDIAYVNQFFEGDLTIQADMTIDQCTGVFSIFAHYDPATGDKYQLRKSDILTLNMVLVGDSSVGLSNAATGTTYKLDIVDEVCYAYRDDELIGSVPCANRTSGYAGFSLGEENDAPIMGYTTTQMAPLSQQTLTVTNCIASETYTWSATAGTFNPSQGCSVTYTAPTADCGGSQPIVTVTGCGGSDQLEIIVSGYPNDCAVAYRYDVCYTYGPCGGQCYYIEYNCDGLPFDTATCQTGYDPDLEPCTPDIPGCLGHTGNDGPWTSSYSYVLCPLPTGDVRTQEMIDTGCCPEGF